MIALIENTIDRVAKIALNLLIIAATALVVCAIWSDVWSGSYLIEPISVPESFGKNVLDKDGVASFLRDEIGQLAEHARSKVAVAPILQDQQQPDIVIAGTKLSFHYVADLLRTFVGRGYPRIAGEITTDATSQSPSVQGDPADRKIRLTLRLLDGANGSFFDEEGDYRLLIKRGALASLAVIDPYSAANYLGLGGTEEKLKGLALISRAEAVSVHRELPPWIQSLGILASNDIPRGELARANIWLSMRQFYLAERYFNRANEEFKKRNLGHDWYPAWDGLATSLILQNDYDAALRLVSYALRLQPNYDSALYHLGEIYDFRSRGVFRKTESKDTCAAQDDIKQALNAYENLLKLYPDFAVAYSQQGVMLLQQLYYLKRNVSTGCSSTPKTVEQIRLLLDRIEFAIADNFQQATMRDPTLSDAWFQWGILLFQKQETDLLQSHSESTIDRLQFLDAAIDKYNHATLQKPGDAYIWRRLGEALEGRFCLTENGDDYQRQAVDALNKSLDLNGSDHDTRFDLKVITETKKPCDQDMWK